MTAKVEKRREFLINLLFLAAVLALIYVFFKYLFWVTAPFILTFFFAVLLQTPLRKIDKKTNKKHHTLWSVLLVVIAIVIVLLPLGLIIGTAISRVVSVVKSFATQMNDIPTFLTKLESEIVDLIRFLPDSMEKTATATVQKFFDPLIEDFDISKLKLGSLKSGISSGLSGMVSVVKNVPSIVIGVVIGIIAMIFFTKDYDRIVRFIQAQLPENKKNFPVEIKQVFSNTIFKMIKAYALIMFITFMELFLGFSFLSLIGVMSNKYFLFIAILIAIFDIMPIAGSGGVLIPWAFVSLIMQNYRQAIGLIVMYIIITVIRQYIEPKIVGDSLGVHPLVTLMGLYFGLKLFGFLGMFIVPITVMTLKAFNDTGRIHLWVPPEKAKIVLEEKKSKKQNNAN
ncbi:MAG: sporulation integral membrane protein YtvI [Ruminococcaceae bacterium]|nr:sporulation integral membrane protein YtvI [Oscillospiraceae bacterium]